MRSVPYGLTLFHTHITHGSLFTSRADVAGDMAAAGVPPELSAGFTSWHMPGHLGEIPKTAVMFERNATTDDRVAAVRQGARFMAGLLGVPDAAAAEHFPGRTPAGAERFFDGVRDTFVRGEVQDYSGNGPTHQAPVLNLAARIGQQVVPDESRRQAIGELYTQWTATWLDQLKADGRDPQELARLAQHAGKLSTAMGALLVLGNEGHPALAQLGAMGGMEEAANPFAGVRRRIHTYTTALVMQHGGKVGLREAASLRRQTEADLYREGVKGLDRRQAGVFDTVAWFAIKAPWVDRAGDGFAWPLRRVSARHLETAVKGTWPR